MCINETNPKKIIQVYEIKLTAEENWVGLDHRAMLEKINQIK